MFRRFLLRIDTLRSLACMIAARLGRYWCFVYAARKARSTFASELRYALAMRRNAMMCLHQALLAAEDGDEAGIETYVATIRNGVELLAPHAKSFLEAFASGISEYVEDRMWRIREQVSGDDD